MTFVTVGTQPLVTRLITAMNALARDLNKEVIAQTGPEANAAALPAPAL